MNTAALPPTLVPLDPPPMAWRLGYAGLIPFVFGALLVWLVTGEAHPYVAAALSAQAGVACPELPIGRLQDALLAAGDVRQLLAMHRLGRKGAR